MGIYSWGLARRGPKAAHEVKKIVKHRLFARRRQSLEMLVASWQILKHCHSDRIKCNVPLHMRASTPAQRGCGVVCATGVAWAEDAPGLGSLRTRTRVSLGGGHLVQTLQTFRCADVFPGTRMAGRKHFVL